MTNEEIIAVVTAHMKGKTIERYDITTDGWYEVPDPVWDFFHFYYRIKPESHHRPFESAEEVMEAIKKHGDWVKVKTSGRYVSVKSFDCEYVWFGSDHLGRTHKEGYEIVTFADGTPFGRLVEER